MAGTSQAIQRLILYPTNTRGTGSIPGRELLVRSHMPCHHTHTHTHARTHARTHEIKTKNKVGPIRALTMQDSCNVKHVRSY